MAGQVEGDEGPVEGQGHGVPGVGVLGAAVEQHDLRIARAPHEGAHRPARRHLDRTSLHRRRAAPRQARLLGVLAEHPQLVVGSRHEN